MFLIEPCCSQKHLRQLREAIKDGGTAQFEGYGDLSLTELLPALLIRYSGTEMVIAAPSLPDQAADIIGRWMRKQWARMDGRGRAYVISHLTVIAGLGGQESPAASAWKREGTFGGRLTLIDRQQTDTAILLPDFAITGPVNMRYGHRFTATATTDPERVSGLWEKYRALAGGSDDQL